jgi:hypothetical protein
MLEKYRGIKGNKGKSGEIHRKNLTKKFDDYIIIGHA